MNPPARVTLKPGRDGPVRGGNPWIFSGAIARVEPAVVEPGELVEVVDADANLRGLGYYNPATTIAVRLLAWNEAPPIEELIERRLRAAIELRRSIVGSGTNAYRLVNGDGDGLSGLVVDRYGDVLVMQVLTAGMERMRSLVIDALSTLQAPQAIFERSQGAVRKEEGLADRVGPIAGDLPGEIIATENGINLAIDVQRGQKTGYFLDQRDNRMRLAALAPGARVLDAYCYAGGFTLAALRSGASHVVAIDTSAKALDWAQHNLELNGWSGRADLIRADAARFLGETDQRFDLIVMDPPPFARSRGDASRAEHLYVELNAHAMRALAPGGHLMTFSCSVHFHGPDFIRALRMAQTKAARPLRLLAHLGAGADHPVLLGHVEGEYLSGALLRDLG
jgi:23S rRNA (cytosine1962-C5)-methyltransferase